jgi:LOB domain-containing protein 29
MTSFGSPCGACKFLRRKCVRGCVFAPYFCHEQGAAHFAAIHKVFGASNVSKLLAHLPLVDRPEAAVTISYEAQARLRDPIYGCVAHIFALQQQVPLPSSFSATDRYLSFVLLFMGC